MTLFYVRVFVNMTNTWTAEGMQYMNKDIQREKNNLSVK